MPLNYQEFESAQNEPSMAVTGFIKLEKNKKYVSEAPKIVFLTVL